MFENNDVLVVNYTIEDSNKTHKSIIKLSEENIGISTGTRFGLTIDSSVKTGKSIDLIISDIAEEETLEASGEILTAEPIKNVRKGWFCLVEVKEVKKY